MATRADGGGSAPHSISASSSSDTTCPAFSSNDASTARCPPRGTGTTAVPLRTTTGPSRQNSIPGSIECLRLAARKPDLMTRC